MTFTKKLWYNIGRHLFDNPIETYPPMTQEQEMGLFSQLYENPAFKKFLDAREEYLAKQSVEAFVAGKDVKRDEYIGRINELRNLRARVKTIHGIMDAARKKKAEALKKGAK